MVNEQTTHIRNRRKADLTQPNYEHGHNEALE